MPVSEREKQAQSLTDLLEEASKHPVIVENDKGERFALMALDDDVIDLLLERNPRFRKELREIAERVDAGESYTLEEVMERLGITREDLDRVAKEAPLEYDIKRLRDV